MSPAVARRSPHGHELPLLERRRLEVVQRLRACPGVRYSWGIVNGCLHPEPGAPVSVMLAIRTAEGIVTGELQFPREKFQVDEAARLLDSHGRLV